MQQQLPAKIGSGTQNAVSSSTGSDVYKRNNVDLRYKRNNTTNVVQLQIQNENTCKMQVGMSIAALATLPTAACAPAASMSTAVT